MNRGQEERTMAGTPINWSSATQASFAAGPLFLLGTLFGIWADNPAKGFEVELTGSMIIWVPLLMPLAALVGAILGLVPNLLGAKLMAWLGDRNEAARLPVMWALSGGIACAVPLIVFGAGSPDTHSMLIAFTFTGACCGLICRRRVEWQH
jgi:hypothetical protein